MLPSVSAQNTDVYPSPLRNWDAKSWIRSKPTRTDSLAGLPFPIKLVPLALHPKIAASPKLQLQVLAYRLLAHLRFTTLLELEHVNPVCSELGRGISPVTLTESQKNDALRIYCDEGGHALFVELLCKEIEDYYQVSAEHLGLPEFHRNLEKMMKENSSVISPSLLHHFFVSVSETLVTKILKDIPHDPEVAPTVREVIGDHANDEATHSVYFRWYFPNLWQALSYGEKLIVGSTLPKLVWTFLSPDKAVDQRVLEVLGYSSKEARAMIFDVYDPQTVRESIQQAAKPTLAMFEKAGVFELKEVKQAFIQKGLLSA